MLKRHRGIIAHVAQCAREREHIARALIRERPQLHAKEIEGDHSARGPMCVCERAQRAYANARERGREHNAHAHMLSQLHAPSWGTMPGSVGAPGAARACPQVRARGVRHLLQHTENGETIKTYVCNICV
jgi:hypothetical protein